MREIKCKFCGAVSQKYDHDGELFCNRGCYMAWKREHPNRKPYKSEITIGKYVYIYKPNHPNAIKNGRYIAQHRLIAEENIGRLLYEKEVVHHINGDTFDNRPPNIQVLFCEGQNHLTAVSRERNEYGKLK